MVALQRKRRMVVSKKARDFPCFFDVEDSIQPYGNLCPSVSHIAGAHFCATSLRSPQPENTTALLRCQPFSSPWDFPFQDRESKGWSFDHFLSRSHCDQLRRTHGCMIKSKPLTISALHYQGTQEENEPLLLIPSILPYLPRVFLQKLFKG